MSAHTNELGSAYKLFDQLQAARDLSVDQAWERLNRPAQLIETACGRTREQLHKGLTIRSSRTYFESMQKIKAHLGKYVAHMKAAVFRPMPDGVPMPPQPLHRNAKAGKSAAPFRKLRKAS